MIPQGFVFKKAFYGGKNDEFNFCLQMFFNRL